MKRAQLAFLAAAFAALSPATLAGPAAPRAPHRSAESGVALRIDVSDGAYSTARGAKVNLTHEGIPEIGWPSMTMDMALLEGARIRDVRVGEPVWFILAIGPDGGYALKEIAPKAGPKPVVHSGSILTKGVVNTLP